MASALIFACWKHDSDAVLDESISACLCRIASVRQVSSRSCYFWLSRASCYALLIALTSSNAIEVFPRTTFKSALPCCLSLSRNHIEGSFGYLWVSEAWLFSIWIPLIVEMTFRAGSLRSCSRVPEQTTLIGRLPLFLRNSSNRGLVKSLHLFSALPTSASIKAV